MKHSEQPRVGRGYIAALMLGTCGSFMAFVTTLAYSLAVRVAELTPGHPEYLGYLTGLGGAVALIEGPVVGVVSDRVRTRFGRRRPVIAAGALVGLAALVVVGFAPDIGTLAIGWVLAVTGWGAAMSAMGALQADKLPPGQRGTVAGLNGFVQQSAPVLGVVVAGLLVHQGLLLTLVPGLIGVLLMVPLFFVADEKDTRTEFFEDRFSLRMLLRKYRYNPRHHPDFSWEWLGRFCVFAGLALNTTFLTFFFAHRLEVEVAAVAQTMAVVSAVGVAAASVGSIGGGYLSDRLGRRRVFALLATLIYGAGAVVYAIGSDIGTFVIAAALSNLGLGIFIAADSALVFDLLPDRREAGRYMAIMGLATTVSRSIAPLVAPLLLAIGAGNNYTVLYLFGGALVASGGLVILLRVKGVR
ncbi:MFS transporter [Nocardia goodfellowii]